jgi:hypothetical protein
MNLIFSLSIRQKIFQYFLTNTGTGMQDKEFAIKEIKITVMENLKKNSQIWIHLMTKQNN